jgi:hypothetical protein
MKIPAENTMQDAVKTELLRAIKKAEVSILDATDDADLSANLALAIKQLSAAYQKIMWVEARGTSDAKRFKRTQRNNTSGSKGVTFNKNAGKWQAKIGNGTGNAKHLGYFETMDLAVMARTKAEAEMWGMRN